MWEVAQFCDLLGGFQFGADCFESNFYILYPNMSKTNTHFKVKGSRLVLKEGGCMVIQMSYY